MTTKQHSERAGKYRGYVITPVYFAGSDFTMTKDNCIKTRKPTKADVEYYKFTEVGEVRRQGAEFTVSECKARIDALLAAAAAERVRASEEANVLRRTFAGLSDEACLVVRGMVEYCIGSAVGMGMDEGFSSFDPDVKYPFRVELEKFVGEDQ